MDKFLKVKEEIARRAIPVKKVWEYHDPDQWTLMLEEKSSGQQFRVEGNNKVNVEDTAKYIETTVAGLRKRYRGVKLAPAQIGIGHLDEAVPQEDAVLQAVPFVEH